jgi:ABC-2 type transport system ATP-binding protein
VAASSTKKLDAPVVIEVRDLKKAFRIPTHRVDSFKERIVKPMASREYRELKALDGISFDVHQGEFFGIVGRNGSGKSTLLKILASIYRADAGTIRMAGRLAPFIELGVGFNMDLSARENVVLNGVMMGLTPKETRNRLDAVIEFAELEEFAELKLKNYSSGMLVRLAFSTMMEADADIMLIDEVLAVGDAAFQQKCADAFHEMKSRGKTIILVTHSMAAAEEYCHRAMLISDGHITEMGDPSDIGRAYLRLNFERDLGKGAAELIPEKDEVNLDECKLENEAGEEVTSLEEGDPIHLHAKFSVSRDVSGILIGFIIANHEGIPVFEFAKEVEPGEEEWELKAGQEVEIEARVENPLTPGRYFVHVGVNRRHGDAGAALYVHNAVGFVVFGTHDSTSGLLVLPSEVTAKVDDGEVR